ncbi:carboxylesterase family protein [Burkholderia sp. WSM2232]|uniref:carboxylesterase family protein n=1 Tax=Burkholderia sp. WSM2232 TaxID=944436 RepID=UPI0012EBCE5B
MRFNNASARATHGNEVPYLFGTLDSVTPTEPWTSSDYLTSTQMQQYWTNLAKRGDPNGSSLTTWAQAGSGQHLEFTGAGGPQAASNLQPLQCSVFENWENANLASRRLIDDQRLA